MARPTEVVFGGPEYRLLHAGGPRGATPLTPHFHDEYVICVQLRGHEECEVAGRPYGFDEGDVVLINPGQVHTGNARGSAAVEYLSLSIDRAFVRRLALEVGAPREPEFVRVRVPGDVELVAALRRMWSWAASADAPIDDPLAAVVGRALEVHSNLHEPRLLSSQRCAHRDVARALAWLRAHALSPDAPPLTVAALAREAGLSRFHFLREFSRHVGMTPGAYVRSLRLCHAARELRSSPRPVAEIARSLGFADRRSFTRAFVRHAGVTPTAFRQRA
ncbi:MAG: AraC family transcriptional regulator [Myxococcales bacterium]|nr:AraC family transcriptional regulator [Myxococcales bacterium]